MMYARIAGIGSFLPEKVVTNHDLAKTMDTSDEWIRERTGIKRRHIAGDNETTSTMGVEAAKRAMASAGGRAASSNGRSHLRPGVALAARLDGLRFQRAVERNGSVDAAHASPEFFENRR